MGVSAAKASNLLGNTTTAAASSVSQVPRPHRTVIRTTKKETIKSNKGTTTAVRRKAISHSRGRPAITLTRREVPCLRSRKEAAIDDQSTLFKQRGVSLIPRAPDELIAAREQARKEIITAARTRDSNNSQASRWSEDWKTESISMDDKVMNKASESQKTGEDEAKTEEQKYWEARILIIASNKSKTANYKAFNKATSKRVQPEQVIVPKTEEVIVPKTERDTTVKEGPQKRRETSPDISRRGKCVARPKVIKDSCIK